MAIGPRAEDLGRIRLALVLFRISAAFTGVFLIALLIFWITRYTIGDLFFFPGAETPFQWHLKDLYEVTPQIVEGGINLTTMLLIVHGWLYVAYLLIDFALWRLVRFPFSYFVLVALGGVVPFLSFYYEYGVPKRVKKAIAPLQPGAATAGATTPPTTTDPVGADA